MCYRYTIKTNPKEVATLFDLADVPEIPPRYNLALTQQAPCIRDHVLANLRFGLIPAWAKDAKMSQGNARGETVATTNMFRSAFKKRRCLVLATGFYEFQERNKKKYPQHIYLKDSNLFAFAGIWESWTPPTGGTVESFAIITTEPNELVAQFHKRMPVILPPKCYDQWMDHNEPIEAVQKLLVPYPTDAMTSQEVSTYYNNARNEGPAPSDHLFS